MRGRKEEPDLDFLRCLKLMKDEELFESLEGAQKLPDSDFKMMISEAIQRLFLGYRNIENIYNEL